MTKGLKKRKNKITGLNRDKAYKPKNKVHVYSGVEKL